ncbi:MAG TPA: hypothetical protein VH143_32920 [Kofleriaceae bacterium]|jgi:hypothetical protein|nr:hypothetical protein [Kofleriaceae bacterium]
MKALVLIATCAALAACYSPNLGNEPFACGSAAPLCPDGYSCSSGMCVSGGGNVSGTDGGNNNGCSDEAIEPNNSYTAAFVTPVASQKMTFTMTGLAICPAGDIDVYELTTSADMQTLTAAINYGASGAALDMQILNANGMSVKNGTATSGMSNIVSASVADLASNSNYFVEVQASMPSDQNSYTLTINVSN